MTEPVSVTETTDDWQRVLSATRVEQAEAKQEGSRRASVSLVRHAFNREDRRVNRIKAVQRALDTRVKPVYLEIGVSRGFAFRRIVADQKIAVDPAFKLSARSRRLADEKEIGRAHV